MRYLMMIALLVLTAQIANPAQAASDTAKKQQPFISANWSARNVALAPDPTPPLRTARPASNASLWFPEAEYPAEAIAKSLTGSVVLDIQLDASGKMLACKMSQIKGDPILHHNACQTVQKRGQFIAELDSNGVAVAAALEVAVYWGLYDPDNVAKAPGPDQTRRVDYDTADTSHWRPKSNSNYVALSSMYWVVEKPKDQSLPKSASAGVDFTISPSGQVVDCSVRMSSGSVPIDIASCKGVKTAIASFRYRAPITDTPLSAMVHWNNTSAELQIADYKNSIGPQLTAGTLELADADRPAGPPPHYALTYVGIKTGLDGRVSSCTIKSSTNNDSYDRQSCALVKARARFSPARDSLGHATYGVVTLAVNWSRLQAYWPTDYSASFDEEVAACRAGLGEACATAGNARLGGYWSRRDEKITYDAKHGVALLEQGCTASNTLACRRLGEVYRAGKDAEKSLPTAVQYFETACRGPEGYSDDRACVALAEMLMNGDGIATDQQRAVTLFAGACVGWRDDGCPGLGKAYENGTGVAADIQKAVEIYSANCAGYKRKTCAALEKMRYYGNGVELDQPRAVAYFEKACRSPTDKNAQHQACLFAGNAYVSGTGVVQNIRLGAGMWNVACQRGSAEACANIGNAAADGALGRKDETVAITFWRAALELDPLQPLALEALRRRKLVAK
jgi:TonB family protein